MKKIYLLFLFLLQLCIYPFTPDFIVDQNGKGDFNSIQKALDAVPFDAERTYIIFINNGVYNEKLFITKSNITVIGENRDSTKIIYAELRKNWRAVNPSDYGSSVINLKDNVTDITFLSLTVHNNYGSLYKDNDHQFAIRGGSGVTRIIIDDCSIIADGGDALSLWNTCDGMYYHNNSYFEGYVDFVCPRGYCYIENSHFFGHSTTALIWHDGSGNRDHKLVIKNSSFDGVPGFSLGRYHREAQFFLIDCTFSNNLADKEIYFAESTPPRILQWGAGRVYFYNCHGDCLDYLWHADNLETAEGSPEAEQINIKSTFRDLWNPVMVLEKYHNKKQ